MDVAQVIAEGDRHLVQLLRDRRELLQPVHRRLDVEAQKAAERRAVAEDRGQAGIIGERALAALGGDHPGHRCLFALRRDREEHAAVGLRAIDRQGDRAPVLIDERLGLGVLAELLVDLLLQLRAGADHPAVDRDIAALAGVRGELPGDVLREFRPEHRLGRELRAPGPPRVAGGRARLEVLDGGGGEGRPLLVEDREAAHAVVEPLALLDVRVDRGRDLRLVELGELGPGVDREGPELLDLGGVGRRRVAVERGDQERAGGQRLDEGRVDQATAGHLRVLLGLAAGGRDRGEAQADAGLGDVDVGGELVVLREAAEVLLGRGLVVVEPLLDRGVDLLVAGLVRGRVRHLVELGHQALDLLLVLRPDRPGVGDELEVADHRTATVDDVGLEVALGLLEEITVGRDGDMVAEGVDVDLLALEDVDRGVAGGVRLAAGLAEILEQRLDAALVAEGAGDRLLPGLEVDDRAAHRLAEVHVLGDHALLVEGDRDQRLERRLVEEVLVLRGDELLADVDEQLRGVGEGEVAEDPLVVSDPLDAGDLDLGELLGDLGGDLCSLGLVGRRGVSRGLGGLLLFLLATAAEGQHEGQRGDRGECEDVALGSHVAGGGDASGACYPKTLGPAQDGTRTRRIAHIKLLQPCETSISP